MQCHAEMMSPRAKTVALRDQHDQIAPMRNWFILSLAAAGLAALTAGAQASASAWHDSEGGRIRLVTTGKADDRGRIRGALEIALKPGWKTYWRDPGDSGVPPQLDVSGSANIAEVDVSFPPPRRHDDGYGQWVGYDHPVTLPIAFTVADPGQPTRIDVDAFLGMCETICIPVQARLEVDPSIDADNGDDLEVVNAGLSSLPSAEQADFKASVVHSEPEVLTVEARLPGNADTADLFVAGDQGYMLGPPTRVARNGDTIRFSVPVIDHPDETPTGPGLHYTLTGDKGAVQGFLPYP